MPSFTQSRSPVFWAFWLAAAVLLVGALVAATQVSMGGGDTTNASVELSAANSRKRPRVCTNTTAATPKANAWSKTGDYIDKRGNLQHIGDGAVTPAERTGST